MCGDKDIHHLVLRSCLVMRVRMPSSVVQLSHGDARVEFDSGPSFAHLTQH